MNDKDDAEPLPWLRRTAKNGRQGPVESAKSYAAFAAYYQTPCHIRSISKVASALKKHPRLLERWSAQHDWIPRAAAWDRHCEELQAQAAAEQLAQNVQRWSARNEERREQLFQLTKDALAKVAQMLTFPLTEKVTSQASKDGEKQVILRPARWNMGHVAQLLAISSQISQAVIGDDLPVNEEDDYVIVDYKSPTK